MLVVVLVLVELVLVELDGVQPSTRRLPSSRTEPPLSPMTTISTSCGVAPTVHIPSSHSTVGNAPRARTSVRLDSTDPSPEHCRRSRVPASTSATYTALVPSVRPIESTSVPPGGPQVTSTMAVDWLTSMASASLSSWMSFDSPIAS